MSHDAPKGSETDGALLLGTSGFSFKDWVGVIYPAGTRPQEMLERYAQRFGAVEINSTYYRLPSPSVMERMATRTPRDFVFTVKLHQDVTHRKTADPAAFDAFRAVVAPLQAAGKFHGALAQFPYAFRGTRENARYLKLLRAALPEMPLWVEFRHASWAVEKVFEFLEGQGLGFCSVDEPTLPGLFPPLARRVGPDAYVRFHGRNAAAWWGGDNAGRYDYLYSEGELGEWAEKIRELRAKSRRTYVFFNNCHDGNAARNAEEFARMVGGLA